MNGGIPTKFGGMGLGILDECIITEEIAFGCTGIYTALSANGLAVSVGGYTALSANGLAVSVGDTQHCLPMD